MTQHRTMIVIAAATIILVLFVPLREWWLSKKHTGRYTLTARGRRVR